MQNKPNFQKSQIYLSFFNKMTYENISNWTLGQNKPKTNPILSAVGGFQMNVCIFLTMTYENISNWTLGQNKPNSNPISENPK